MGENKQTSQRSIARAILSLPLRFKISIPYLIVASLLAGLASYTIGRSFVSTLQNRFLSQLVDAAERVDEGVIEVEALNLQMLRTMAFTLGVPDALAENDKIELNNLLFPHIINNQFYYVEVLGSNGSPLRSWHRVGESLEYDRDVFTEYTDWSLVQTVLMGESDKLGDKYVDIIDTPWGLILYTAGSVRSEDELYGMILVGSPLINMTIDLGILSISNVSIYDPLGQPVTSMLGVESISELGDGLITEARNAERVLPTRNISVKNRRAYIEASKPLYLRGVPTDWFIGIALPESLVTEAQGPTTTKLVLIFSLGVLALIGLGVIVAQLIATPVFLLVDASRKVGSGNFNVEVEVMADDEIGLLAKGFNRMVIGLQQREFIREMFGRMVSEEISDAVINGQVELGGEIREVVVLFTDVRGFTSMSEKIAPEEVIILLNQFFAIVTSATRKYRGVVNYFGGDSVLAVFGAPIERPVEESLQQSILAAIEIRQGVIGLNARRISEGLSPLGFGIGINSGSVVAGNIGSKDRFAYTVIGDVVNVAARLQTLSREFSRTPLLIPSTGVEPVKGKLDVGFQHLGEFVLKGKEKPVSTYAILGRTSIIPDSFTGFDGLGLPQIDALLACSLYCLDYSEDIIAETLQSSIQEIHEIISIALEHGEEVAGMLRDGFNLPKTVLNKLTPESNNEISA